MISKSDVIMAYQLILGRDPESDEIVTQIAERGYTLAQLRQHFMQSAEFLEKQNVNKPGMLRSQNCDPLNIELDVDSGTLNQLYGHIEKTWSHLGETEPHYSVITQDKFKAATVDEYTDEFYESGLENVVALQKSLERCGLSIDDFRDCLELGCGVGRITLKLSERFGHVYGLDISAPHIELAKTKAQEKNIDNVSFLRMSSINSFDALPDFDVFFSLIVLQHNPPPIMQQILVRILSKLRVGGVAYFQIPTYGLGYKFDVRSYLEMIKSQNIMEMHIYPQSRLMKLIADLGCFVLEVREDEFVGDPNWISNTFLIQKAAYV